MNSFALYNLVTSKDSKEYFHKLYFSKIRRKIQIQDLMIKKGASLIVIKEDLAGGFGRSYVNFYTIQKMERNQLDVCINIAPLIIGFN